MWDRLVVEIKPEQEPKKLKPLRKLETPKVWHGVEVTQHPIERAHAFDYLRCCSISHIQFDCLMSLRLGIDIVVDGMGSNFANAGPLSSVGYAKTTVSSLIKKGLIKINKREKYEITDLGLYSMRYAASLRLRPRIIDALIRAVAAAMTILFRTITAAVYKQWLKGHSAPYLIELNADQLRRFHAERADGCREIGVSAPEFNGILGIPIVECESSPGELVTVDGKRIALVQH